MSHATEVNAAIQTNANRIREAVKDLAAPDQMSGKALMRTLQLLIENESSQVKELGDQHEQRRAAYADVAQRLHQIAMSGKC